MCHRSIPLEFTKMESPPIPTVHPLTAASASVVIGIIYTAVIRRIHSDRYRHRNMAGRILDIGRSVGHNRIHLLIQPGIRSPALPLRQIKRIDAARAYHPYIVTTSYDAEEARLISAWRVETGSFATAQRSRCVSAKPRRILAFVKGNIYYPEIVVASASLNRTPTPRGHQTSFTRNFSRGS